MNKLNNATPNEDAMAVCGETCKYSPSVVLVTVGDTTAHAQQLSVCLCKMASFTPQQKVHWCYWLAEFMHPGTVQHKLHQKDGCDPRKRRSIVN
jgi:hypothetical protein